VERSGTALSFSLARKSAFHYSRFGSHDVLNIFRFKEGSMETRKKLTKKVTLHDLTVRDGFQTEQQVIPTEAKLWIINTLIEVGFRHLEVTNFGPPKFQPQFRDAEQVLAGLPDRHDMVYSCTTMGRKATERALAARRQGNRVDRILLGIVPASEKYNKIIVGMDYKDTWKWIKEVSEQAHQLGMKVNAVLTGIFSPPSSEEKSIDMMERALEFTQHALDLGVDDIEHPDHLGEATPDRTYEYFLRVLQKHPDPERHIFHIHDARGMGLACYYAAMTAGITHFEVTLGGLGGWPANFVNGTPVGGLKGLVEVSRRPGLVSTEDCAVMLDAMGVESGIDVDKLLMLGKKVEKIVGRELWSMCLGRNGIPGSGRVPKEVGVEPAMEGK
jgi:hydroxymethylglutaryl-CoA lyase